MTKRNELNNLRMNNSSALVAPSRSEIRIYVTIPVINFRKLLFKMCHSAMVSSTVKFASIVSASALSFIYMLELSASVPLMVFLSIMCVATSLFSFMGILNELGGFRAMIDDIKKEH